METHREEFSLYYTICIGVPLLIVVLIGSFVSWWLALVLWLVGGLAYFIQWRPIRRDWPIWRNVIIVLAGIVYGPTFIAATVLDKLFPKLANL